MNWFDQLAPMPDPVAHAAFRARMQEVLTTWSQAVGGLAAMQARAMAHDDRPVSGKDALMMKRFEKAIADAKQLARVNADAYHQGLASADRATWDGVIQIADSALSLAVTRMQAGFVSGGGAGKVSDTDEAAIGNAILMMAWAMCDAPIALRIMRAGELAREAAAR